MLMTLSSQYWLLSDISRSASQAYGVVPEKLGWQIARLLRSECQDFHFGTLVAHYFPNQKAWKWKPVGVYILTPGLNLSDKLKQEIRLAVVQHMGLSRGEVRFFSQEDQE
jgi:hypothetical protein